MTHLARQTYQDVDLSEINTHNHPICQLKYDGIWCDAHVTDSLITYISRHGLVKKTTSIPRHSLQPGHYIGEFMFGSEWAQDLTRKDNLYLFDYLSPDYKSDWQKPYQNRIETLKGIELPKSWAVVDSFDSKEKDNIWELLVAPGHFEGLVFRHPQDTWLHTLLRAKGEVTEDLMIVGFEVGEGRLSNTLGAVLCKDGKNPDMTHVVGGGFTDAQRNRIWNNRMDYVGKWIRVIAKKKFASGLLRHPNFHSFHEDK